MRETSSGKPPVQGTEHLPAPGPIDPTTGQHTDYWVLSADERQKGFVRPVRNSYQHVGIPGPTYPLRDLTAEEFAMWDGAFDKFEAFPEGMTSRGRWWTQEELDSVGKGCGTVTTMSTAIAETYAASPHYYGATFCCACRRHLPVGEHGEFVWAGTSERVGT
jgi:hypothetical protein